MNPIAFQSKEHIVRALFMLMKKDQYEKLTISEIAANANLDRRTFYRHFKNKDEIIRYYFESSAQDFEDAFRKNTIHDNRAISKTIFTICLKQKSTLKLILKHNLSHVMLAEISKLFRKFQKQFASKEELEHPHRNYMLAYHIGGFWNIINEWLLHGCKESPEEMANIITEMMEINQI